MPGAMRSQKWDSNHALGSSRGAQGLCCPLDSRLLLYLGRRGGERRGCQHLLCRTLLIHHAASTDSLLETRLCFLHELPLLLFC